jgi:adenylylsulfate kinase-like enzyme
VNILVSGAPGAGKSTLARILASSCGFGLIEKDDIKEALADTLGFGGPERHEELKRASYEVMARIITVSENLILVANFPSYFGGLVHQSRSRLLEVHCACGIEVCRARFAERHDRHAVHPPALLRDEEIAPYQRPLGIGPVMTIDTDKSYDVDEVISRVLGVLVPPCREIPKIDLPKS